MKYKGKYVTEGKNTFYYTPKEQIESKLLANHKDSLISKSHDLFSSAGSYIHNAHYAIKPYAERAAHGIENYSERLEGYQHSRKRARPVTSFISYSPSKLRRYKKNKKIKRHVAKDYDSPFDSNAVEFGGIGDMNIGL